MTRQVNMLHLSFSQLSFDIPNLLAVLSSWKLDNDFLLILWQTSMRSVGILHPSFSKMASTFSSKASASASLGMPTISRHSRLEYCVFNQHWRSMLTGLFDRRVFTCFVADTSACNLEKDYFNLRNSTSTLLFTPSSFFWSDKIIGIRSFLLLFCNDLFV